MKTIYTLYIGDRCVGKVFTKKEAEAHVKSIPWDASKFYGYKIWRQDGD